MKIDPRPALLIYDDRRNLQNIFIVLSIIHNNISGKGCLNTRIFKESWFAFSEEKFG